MKTNILNKCFLLSSIAFLVFISCKQDTSVNIKDMVLIYNGGKHRSVVWNETHFEPYVSFTDNRDGKEKWLFDGFLFLEIKDGKGRGYASGYEHLPARKEEWLSLIEGYLTPGNGIQALNSCIEQAKLKNKTSFNKRKIVISLPEPIPGQLDWGEIESKKLDFTKDEDRIAACKWYIDYIIREFNKAGMKNVELAGFYWLAEEASNTRTFVGKVAEYIHQKGFRFYWIPYFQSDGYNEWKELGFDQAFLQPNHFFNSSIPDARIDVTCELARKHGMSLEVEFDERATEKGGMANRLHTYIDGFKRNGVFDSCDVAYYQGDDALYQLKNGSESDKELYYKLAYIIAERQLKK